MKPSPPPIHRAASLAEAVRAIGYGTGMTVGLVVCLGYHASWGLIACAAYGCALTAAVLLQHRA